MQSEILAMICYAQYFFLEDGWHVVVGLILLAVAEEGDEVEIVPQKDILSGRECMSDERADTHNRERDYIEDNAPTKYNGGCKCRDKVCYTHCGQRAADCA